MEIILLFLVIALIGALIYGGLLAHQSLLNAQVEWRKDVEKDRDAWRELALRTPNNSLAGLGSMSPQIPPVPERMKTQEQEFLALQQTWTPVDWSAFEMWAESYYRGKRPDERQEILDFIAEFGVQTPFEAQRP